MTTSTPLPHFFVAGFPKCGTTTLCQWLSHHPDVASSSPKEPNVFAWDDIDINPFTMHEQPDLWYKTDFDADPALALARYVKVFAHAEPHQLRFDGSPGYAMSRRALRRIKAYTPDAKLIFLLRHPTSRAISDYWHALRHRRVSYDLRQHLRFERSFILAFSRYLEHLTPWFEAFPRDQILILTTDDLGKKSAETCERVASFIGVSSWTPPDEARQNTASTPRFKNIQYALNALPRLWNAPYNTISHEHLGKPSSRNPVERVVTSSIRRLGTLNLQSDTRPPAIDEALKDQLDTYFTRENRGLSELTGIDLATLWGLDI